MNKLMINHREIGPGHPVYVIAEMSANHCHDFDKAVGILHAAKEAGADAVKIQTYRPDTITIDCDNDYFMFKGQSLYSIYEQAYTPWEWHDKLKKIAEDIGIDFFSAPFDFTAVDFLEEQYVPVYKIASSELIDIPLIRRVAATGKPMIMSVGMGSFEEIERAIQAVRDEGNEQLALLKCTATYPALPEEMNLNTIPDLAKQFDVPVGLSDHTLGHDVAVASIALGACIVEKHFTLSRSHECPDASFSMEPDEFKAMVDGIRTIEAALGSVHYGPQGRESISQKYRRSLFVVEDIKEGDVLSESHVRSIRPSQGLDPEVLPEVLGRKAKQDIARGTPLSWDLLE